MTKAKRWTDILTLTAISASIIALLLYNSEVTQAAEKGLTLFLTVVTPCLFPFMVFTSMLVKTGGAGYIGDNVSPMLGRLFNVSRDGVSAFILGLLGGYPMGAKAVCDLYDNRRINQAESEHLLGFCSNSGPAFILGACGAGVFKSTKIGVILLVSHIVSAAVVGVIFRPFSPRFERDVTERHGVTKPASAAFVESVRDSVQGVINISGFVIIFQVMTAVAGTIGIMPTGFTGTLTEGFLELTAGIYRLNGADTRLSTAAASFLIGWGGLCVHCQALSFTVSRGLKARKYFLGKLIQGIISAALTYLAVEIL